MSTPKYTAGPWRVGTPGPNGCPTIGTTKGLMVAMIAHSLNYPNQAIVAKADAHLIAAAPELLEALENAKQALDHVMFALQNDPSFCTAIALKWSYTQTKEAIAKAKGE